MRFKIGDKFVINVDKLIQAKLQSPLPSEVERTKAGACEGLRERLCTVVATMHRGTTLVYEWQGGEYYVGAKFVQKVK